MNDYLVRILARKRKEIEVLRARSRQIEQAASTAPSPKPWAQALRDRPDVALIAEVKRRAPSAGALRLDLDPADLAATYARAGAAAISVLTDRDFDGGLEDLRVARRAVDLPLLRKDFILDPVQVWEARAAGADAILLIVRALEDERLADLLACARAAQLGALVEVHDRADLDRALTAGAEVIGINHRDLTTFETRLSVSSELAPMVPSDRVVVAESGIRSSGEVRGLGELGVDAVLVGRSLVAAADPLAAARSLTGQPKRRRP